MQPDSVYGRILTASQIEAAAEATLRKWFSTYLSEVARQLGIDSVDLPVPRNYTTRNSFDAEKGEDIPKVAIISGGLVGEPLLTGQKTYTARYGLGIGVATAASDEATANTRVKAYGAAVRTIMVQKSDLGGELGIANLTWTRETFDDLPIANQLQLYKAASEVFVVDIENVVRKGGGPTTPTLEAQPPFPTVQKIIIDINNVQSVFTPAVLPSISGSFWEGNGPPAPTLFWQIGDVYMDLLTGDLYRRTG